MEFTEQFTLIQRSLICIQKKEGILKELSFKNSDDAPKMHKVARVLKDIICPERSEATEDIICPERSEATEDIDKLRKLNLFLILNTDLVIQEDLMEDVNCGHLVDCVPTLSKDLLTEIVWALSFQTYVSEAIVFCPPVLSGELVDMMITRMDLLPSHSMQSHCVMFANAVYKKLVALELCGSQQCNDNIKSKFLEYYEILLKQLARSLSVNLENTTETQMYDHAGNAIKHVLKLLNSCLEYYLNYSKEECTVSELYNISESVSCGAWGDCKKELQDGEVITSLNNRLLAMCRDHLMCVTCDMWMYFAECDSEYGKERSLQNYLAENMYLCLQTMKSVESKSLIFKDVIPILESMAVKPRDEDDEIQDASLDVILKNIGNKDKSQKKWFKALFKFQKIILNAECMECIGNNLHLVDHEAVDILLQNITSHLLVSDQNDSADNLKSIGLESLKYLPLQSQLEILDIYLKKLNISTIFVTKTFHMDITELLNKAVNDSGPKKEMFYSNFVRLTLQNPNEVVRKLMLEALTNINQVSLVVDVLKTLWPLKSLVVRALPDGTILSDSSTEGEKADAWGLIMASLYNEILQHKWAEAKEANCIQLVTAVVNEAVMSGEEFQNRVMLPTLHSSLIMKDWTLLALWLHILQVFLDGTVREKSPLNQAVLLAVLAQIIDRTQTTVFSFSTKPVSICERALDLVEMVLVGFLESSDTRDTDIKWLKHKLLVLLRPKHVLYFSKLWYKFGQEPPLPIDHEVIVVHYERLTQGSRKWRKELTNIGTERLQYLTMLLKLLPCSTSKEWRVIARNLRCLIEHASVSESPPLFMFELYADVVLLLAFTITENEELTDDERESAFCCLDFCIRNFGHIMKGEILSQAPSPAAGVAMFEKWMCINEKLPGSVKDSCSGLIANCLVDLIMESANGLHVYSGMESRESITAKLTFSIAKMQDVKTRQALSRKVLEVMDS